MKFKKPVIIICILCIAIIISAFTVLPSIRLQGEQNDIFDISYSKAEVSGNTLTLNVAYESYGTSFEIGRDIAVATDQSFSKPLSLISCVPEDGKYVYTFEYDNELNARASTLYIKPPVLYVPAEIQAVSMPVSTNVSSRTHDGNSWFTISDIAVKNYVEDMFEVSVRITPTSTDLPRFPELVIGESVYVGSTLHNFNSDGVFNYGVFGFLIPANDIDEVYAMLDEATIKVDQALLRVTAPKDSLFSSSVKSISITTE